MASIGQTSKIPRRPGRATKAESLASTPITATATSSSPSSIPRRIDHAAQLSSPSVLTPKAATQAQPSKIPRRPERATQHTICKLTAKVVKKAPPSKKGLSPEGSGGKNDDRQLQINTPGPTMSSDNSNVNTVTGSGHTLNNTNNNITTNIYGLIPNESVNPVHSTWSCYLLKDAPRARHKSKSVLVSDHLVHSGEQRLMVDRPQTTLRSAGSLRRATQLRLYQ